MADNASFSGGKLVTELTLALKQIGAVLYSQGIVVDGDGNEVDFDVLRDTNGGLKVTPWFGNQNRDWSPVSLNGPWIVRQNNNQEYFFSSDNVLPYASIQVKWDHSRVTAQGTGSFRKEYLPTGAAQLEANTSAPWYQGLTRSCQLFRLRGYLAGGSDAYLKLWDRNSAPTIGTDAPTYIVRLPAGNFDVDFEGLAMQSGYYYTIHTTRTGTTLVTAGNVQDLFLIHG